MVSAHDQEDAGQANISRGMAVKQPDQTGAAPGCETMEELFAALESPLLNYALRLTEASSAAEDLVQEAFMKLQAQFKEVREPRRWLYRTVHNLALNHQRQARKIIPLDPASPAAGEAADPRPLPDEQIARSEGIGLVRLTLETLDERSRELIRLKFTENLSYKEISERTGLKTGNVGYLLHHALKSMADELARNGIVP
jgi:RNA polymerase sigma-70 factor (ECF subfamily)